MSLPAEVDVVVVGGGPAGLSAAASLLTRGVKNIVVVDGHQEHEEQYSRALVIHPRTLEVTETIETTDRFVAAGMPVHGMRLNSSTSGLLLVAGTSWYPSKYNFTLSIRQSETERILRERVKELGGNIVWDHKAVGLKEDPNGTKIVTFESGDTVKARYVIGADGTHSVIRQAAGIDYLDPFTSHPTPEEASQAVERFCLADIKVNHLSPAIPGDFVSTMLHPDGGSAMIPLPKQEWRIVCEVRDPDIPKAPPVEFFQKLLDERFPCKEGLKITEMTWSSRFFVKYRLAEKYFVPHLPGTNFVGGPKGGIALAGDAAHVHSPMGGQGMNLGMRDAIFLGEAIAADMVSPDESQPALARWAEERRKAGQKVVQLTGNMTSVAANKAPSWIVAYLRDWVIWTLGMIPFFPRMVSWNMSGLGERPRA